MAAPHGDRADDGHVVVVGGGIAGLAAARALRRAHGEGLRISLLEASDHVGGKLALTSVGDLTVDAGAESVLVRRTEALQLIEDVGLGGRVVHPAAEGASVWVEGVLRRLPRHQLMGVPIDLQDLAASGVLSTGALLRVPLDYVLPRTPIDDDIAIGRYVTERLGREIVERLVDPLLGGVYAGHADDLSLDATMPALGQAARTERSLLHAAERVSRQGLSGDSGQGTLTRDPVEHRPVFASLRGGLGRLPEAVALAAAVELSTGTEVTALRRAKSGWALTTRRGATETQVSADAVVLAVPAPVTARLLRDVSPAAARELDRVEYASVALVTARYPKAAFATMPTGTGFLVPPAEERVVKAATFSSLKWGWLGASRPDEVVLRVSVGRFGETTDLERDDDDLAWAALGELSAAIDAADAPRHVTVTRWDDALPQYRVGHVGLVDRVRLAVAEHPGLAVCGAAYDGVGIPACVASGWSAASQVGAVLRERGE